MALSDQIDQRIAAVEAEIAQRQKQHDANIKQLRDDKTQLQAAKRELAKMADADGLLAALKRQGLL